MCAYFVAAVELRHYRHKKKKSHSQVGCWRVIKKSTVVKVNDHLQECYVTRRSSRARSAKSQVSTPPLPLKAAVRKSAETKGVRNSCVLGIGAVVQFFHSWRRLLQTSCSAEGEQYLRGHAFFWKLENRSVTCRGRVRTPCGRRLGRNYPFIKGKFLFFRVLRAENHEHGDAD